MFQSLFACPASLAWQRLSVPFGPIKLPVLAAGAVLALLAAVATWPQSGADDASAALTIAITADSPDALRDRAEARRETLLTLPGVGAVTLRGLQQQRLFVDYSARHLASFGLSEKDLAAAIQADARLSTPGHLAVSLQTGEAGLQAVENLPVRASARVFRLGDIALVSRARLDPPVSTLRQDGRPAAELAITPASGANIAALRAAIADSDRS